jgi:hypothetical protein
MQRISKTLIITGLIFLPFAVQANVVINEIAWMGTSVSYNDEWIELYNNGSVINLEGWVLKADDGSPEINLSGIIPEKGFYLLERTNDETIPGITADLIYKGALGNNGENLKLYNNSGNLIDQVISLEGWLAGDNSTKQTMEKIGSGWQTSQNPGGTPKTINSIGTIEPEETELLEPEFEPIIIELIEPEQAKLPEQRDIKGIIFNEILPSPDGPDAENEWVEIYNQNDFEVNLSGWQIKDQTGKTKTYTLNEKISAYGYLVFLRPETKITLNNDGDGLNLINPKGEIIDSVVFEKASLNKSYSRISSGWVWNNNLTPGLKNIVPQSSRPTPAKTLTGETKKLEDKTREVSANLTDINLRDLTPENKGSVFAIAFIVALFCSIAFLIIKSNLKSFWY